MSKIEKINNLKKIKDIRPSQQEAMDAVKTLIRWAGDNPQREGLKETPSRVVRSYKDFFHITILLLVVQFRFEKINLIFQLNWYIMVI